MFRPVIAAVALTMKMAEFFAVSPLWGAVGVLPGHDRPADLALRDIVI
jgi:hypothetical protein